MKTGKFSPETASPTHPKKYIRGVQMIWGELAFNQIGRYGGIAAAGGHGGFNCSIMAAFAKVAS